MEGWVKLHRKVMESETFSRLNAIQKLIALYIILNANHTDSVWYDKYKNIEVRIERGQLITSRNKIASEWFGNDKEVTEQKIRTTLDKLEKFGFLTKQSTNGYTLLTVHNYGLYQDREERTNQVINQQLTSNQPATNQQLTTNKNDNNVNNEKEVLKDSQANSSELPLENLGEDKVKGKVKKKYADRVSFTDDEYNKLINKFGGQGTQDRIDNLNNYKCSKNKKYASDYHTILNWERMKSDSPNKGIIVSKFDKTKTMLQEAMEESNNSVTFLDIF